MNGSRKAGEGPRGGVGVNTRIGLFVELHITHTPEQGKSILFSFMFQLNHVDYNIDIAFDFLIIFPLNK